MMIYYPDYYAKSFNADVCVYIYTQSKLNVLIILLHELFACYCHSRLHFLYMCTNSYTL